MLHWSKWLIFFSCTVFTKWLKSTEMVFFRLSSFLKFARHNLHCAKTSHSQMYNSAMIPGFDHVQRCWRSKVPRVLGADHQGLENSVWWSYSSRSRAKGWAWQAFLPIVIITPGQWCYSENITIWFLVQKKWKVITYYKYCKLDAFKPPKNLGNI